LERKHPDTKHDLIVLQVAGQLFFLCLTMLSIYFWKERQAFDAAHYLFEIVDRQFFYVAHHRPLGIVSQVLPVIGVWLHLPLKAIAILYSVGDILWYYLLFLLMAYKIESRRGIIALLLILSLTVRYSFFCPVTELLQGLALLPVWLSLLGRSFRFRIPLLIVIMALIIFSHPLLFFPLAFTFIWWSMSRAEGAKSSNYEKSRLPRYIWPALFVLIAAKMFLLDTYDYQKTFYPVVYKDYGYLKSLSFETIFDLIKMIVGAYPLTCILFLSTALLYLLQQRGKMSLLLLVSVLSYLTIIAATHRFVEISNYSERMLLPLPAMIAIAASGVISFSRVFVPKLIAFVGLILILLLHIDVLRITAKPYTLRVQQMESLTEVSQSLGIRKVIVNEDLLEQNSFAMTGWCYPIETLLMSSFKGPDSSVSVILQKEHVDRIAQQGNLVRAAQWVKWTEVILPVSGLNQNYFKLPEENYLSLNDGHANQISNAILQISSGIKLNTTTYALSVDVLLSKNQVLYPTDSTYLGINFPDGPEIRLTLPYTITNGARLWMELPADVLKKTPDFLLMLHCGKKILAEERVSFDGGQFKTVKP